MELCYTTRTVPIPSCRDIFVLVSLQICINSAVGKVEAERL